MTPDPIAKTKPPWWVYVIPYRGKIPNIDPYQWKILGLLALAELFDHFDTAILGFALVYIQQGLGISETELGNTMALIRMGVIPALGVTILADRVGRRRLLLVTIVGFTLCTFATAFAQSTEQFVALQFLSRMFIYAETMLAVVVIAEELGAKDRGWGIGMLGALGTMGYGCAALMYGFIEDLPYGWRALYAAGALPMLFVAWFRAKLPETRRFEAHKAQRDSAGGWRVWLLPIWQLVKMYPGRIAVLCAAVAPLEFAVMSAAAFMVKTLQEVHGYTPGNVTMLYIFGGILAVVGNVAAGTLSDRLGRRLVLGVLSIMAGVGFFAFYNFSGWIVAAAWVLQVFALTGTSVLFKALGSELFPTSYRSTASGVRSIAGTLGGAAGLAMESVLYGMTGSHGAAITLMIPALLIPPIVISVFLPETAGRELEDISPER